MAKGQRYYKDEFYGVAEFTLNNGMPLVAYPGEVEVIGEAEG